MHVQAKWTKAGIGEQMDKQRLLTEDLVRDLIVFCDAMEDEETGTMIKFAWEFLSRVSSELIPLEVGSMADERGLPEDRHSGVFMENERQGQLARICVRWARRKNMPKGSFLKRQCSCAEQGRQQCLVHRVERIMEGKAPG